MNFIWPNFYRGSTECREKRWTTNRLLPMKNCPYHRVLIGALCLVLVLPLAAQSGAKSESSLLSAALALRTALARAVIDGKQASADVLLQLKASSSPSGLEINADADFALAAIDVGQRLIAARRPAEAEPFFVAAEKALEIAIEKAPDSSAQEKVILLQKLALIRADFLNKMTEAKENLDQAITLQPEDKHLRRKSDLLSDKLTARTNIQPRG